MLIVDADNNTMIYDFENKESYDDIYNYVVYNIYDSDKAKLVIS